MRKDFNLEFLYSEHIFDSVNNFYCILFDRIKLFVMFENSYKLNRHNIIEYSDDIVIN